jgi:pimeloyl-ACP methyl ester carboxylesterase
VTGHASSASHEDDPLESVVSRVTGGLLPCSAWVRSGELSLHCLVWGDDGDPTAVLVHGNGGHAHWWDALVPALVPGWRLVVPDLRGHGESDRPREPAYRIDDYDRDLGAILDALGPDGAALVGHSMGGRITTWFAAHRPERVRGLALLDTRLTAIDPKMAAIWRGRVAGTREGRGYPSRAEALAAFRFVPDESGVAPEIVADLAHHAVFERGPGDWTFRFDRAVLALDGDGAGDLTGLLSRIRCPIVVMNGEQSMLSGGPEEAALRRARPDCSVRRFAGAHHFLISNPRPVGEALREFLDGVVRRTE